MSINVREGRGSDTIAPIGGAGINSLADAFALPANSSSGGFELPSDSAIAEILNLPALPSAGEGTQIALAPAAVLAIPGVPQGIVYVGSAVVAGAVASTDTAKQVFQTGVGLVGQGVDYVKDGVTKVTDWVFNVDNAGSKEPSKGADGGNKSVDQLVGESTEGRETKGRTDQYEHDGGREQRDKDFDSLGVTDITDRGKGTKTGTLPDGRPVNIHDSATGGVPTIQIGKGRREIKIRYP